MNPNSNSTNNSNNTHANKETSSLPAPATKKAKTSVTQKSMSSSIGASAQQKNYEQYRNKPHDGEDTEKYFKLSPKRSATSPVWEWFFQVYKINDGGREYLKKNLRAKEPKDLACCNICGDIKGLTSGSTTNLSNHLKSEHKILLTDNSK